MDEFRFCMTFKNVLIFFALLEVSFCEKRHHIHERNAAPRTGDVTEDGDYWRSLAAQELQETLAVTLNNNVAKNVILFLGDGMSLPTITAARIYKGQLKGQSGEEGWLTFDKFPHTGLIKTYAVDSTVPDSASTGTAYLTGTKTNYGLIGVDATVEERNCSSMTPQSISSSIVKWAQDAGKMTGVVTSTRITHATPANAYAHGAYRYWECDADITQSQYDDCPWIKDFALQLVEDDPGNKLNVIMGGGFQNLDGDAVDRPGDPVDKSWGCVRQDNRTLWREWLDSKSAAGQTAQFARSKSELEQVDLNETEFLMGIFANDHIPYEYQKREMGLDIPTLKDMTQAALELLTQGPNGFFLLVEGGRIDLAHHDNLAHVSIDEAVAMDDAIAAALNMTNSEETLIVVTADHSHVMSLAGYPDRGSPITGIAEVSNEDKLPYMTLSYANGPGYNYTAVDGQVERPDYRTMNTSSFEFVYPSAVPRGSDTHGGDDVTVYALGPMSHLFSSVHEQNYIAHAMGYAACIGADTSHCDTKH